jgi:hypothetical protein
MHLQGHDVHHHLDHFAGVVHVFAVHEHAPSFWSHIDRRHR